MPEKANSLMLVLPTITAPAARSRATTGASSLAGGASSSALEPASVVSPRTLQRFLTDTGIPASSEGTMPAKRSASLASAAASAASRQTLTKARLPSPLGSSMRARAASVSLRELTRPAASSAARCRMVGLSGGVAILLLFAAVLDQVVDHGGIGERRGVTEIGEIVLGDLAQDAPHDLARACLGQAGCPLDDVGRRDRANLLAHPADQLLAHSLGGLLARVQSDVGIDSLALDVVRE